MNNQLPVEFRALHIEPSSKKACEFLARWWLKSARANIAKKRAFTSALTGGSTPKEIYRQIVHLAPEYSLDWTKIHLFWTDERCVPLDHPDSNYLMARNSGILDMPIPKSQVYPMRFGLEPDPEHDGMRYEKLLREKLHSSALDFIFMGMGEDGHTASLFPNSKGFEDLAKTSREKNAANTPIALSHFIESKGVWRMTMTLPFINQSIEKVGLVLGKDKSNIFAAVLNDKRAPYQYPAAWVGVEGSKMNWVADQEAASALV